MIVGFRWTFSASSAPTQAVDRVDEIVNTPGIDAVLGRADLAVAYGVDSIDEPVIEDAVRRVVLAAHRSGIACGVFVAAAEQVHGFTDMGVRPFIVGSDQSMLLRGRTSVGEIVRSNQVNK
ncbi:hypothetical protein CY652_09225 [Burkholderia sp. WAC0059]|uniref:aldolase/citrate lyase family protein n=1 Tax=Burkholderia sp. WAC0059 TaxID=2066022 RepID=UPI000C7F61EC|nr:aldolase/citrate lyase family protein [Burkholderia sp. WAC0059]PLZ02704.1 hypothetical protein CY652_09225 [Burkholderia sp. WAC0059]